MNDENGLKSVSLTKFLLFNNKSVFLFCVPVICTKKDLGNVLRKRLSNSNAFSNIYYVSWDENITSNNLSYSELVATATKTQNVVYIIDSFKSFNIYLSDLFTQGGSKNIYLILYDFGTQKSKEISSKLYAQLYPGFLDLEVNFDYSERKCYMSEEQSKTYLKKYADYQKLNREEVLIEENQNNIPEILGIQNVYIDSVYNSATNNLDVLFSRSPKFRSIITDILLHNKKRHFIKMISGKYGIDSFESMYNLVTLDRSETMFPYLMVIKSSDTLQEKIDKMREFNISNRPMVLLTNFSFGKDLVPKNVDYVRLTNGGRREDLYEIVNLVKAGNYTGSYPRKLEIVCYTSIAKNSITSLDQENYKNFIDYFTEYLRFGNICKNEKNIIDLYIKGEEIYIRVNKN